MGQGAAVIRVILGGVAYSSSTFWKIADDRETINLHSLAEKSAYTNSLSQMIGLPPRAEPMVKTRIVEIPVSCSECGDADAFPLSIFGRIRTRFSFPRYTIQTCGCLQWSGSCQNATVDHTQAQTNNRQIYKGL